MFACSRVSRTVHELIPNGRIEWECISKHPASSPASAWTGTHFVFELAENAGAVTTVDFSQVGYDEQSQFFKFNKDAWAEVMQNLKKAP